MIAVVEGLLAATKAITVMPGVSWVIMLLLVSPSIMLIAISLIVCGSAKARSTEESQQRAIFIVLPVIMLILGQFSVVMLVNAWLLFYIGLVLAAAAAVTLNLKATADTYYDNACALEVGARGALNLSASHGGEFNVTTVDANGHGNSIYGVYAHDGGRAAVTNVTVVLSDSAPDGANGRTFGVYAVDGADIRVAGDITSGFIGAQSGNYGKSAADIIVGGNVNVAADGVNGVSAQSGGAVTVAGDVTGGFSGVDAMESATVTVGGNVYGVLEGVTADDAQVTVAGGATSDGIGIITGSGAEITVGGNVTSNGHVIFPPGSGAAFELGSMIGVDPGVYGEIYGIGVIAIDGGKCKIDGTLTVPRDDSFYIAFMSAAGSGYDVTGIKTPADNETASSSTGYLEYTDGLSYVWVKASPAYYTVTVQSGGNGTAGSDASSAPEGAVITLTATPDSGFQFKEWQVISGGVTVINNRFTMPASNVTVKAIFVGVSPADHTVVFDPNGGYVTPTLAQTGADGRLASLPVPARNGGFIFAGWFTSASGGHR